MTWFIGCMSGTSVDKYIDFSACQFDAKGKISRIHNKSQALPQDLQNRLLSLSQHTIDAINLKDVLHAEYDFTHFLAKAFNTVIRELNLTGNIILSPHGLTIAHQAHHQPYFSHQLLHGECLAQLTQKSVVFRHRQAALAISQAAPLAPLLLKQQCFKLNTHSVFINGGGIANICIINSDGKISAWDTGPANAPIDSLVRYVLNKHSEHIPEFLLPQIKKYKFDVNGQLAALGAVNEPLKNKLLQHEYFQRETLHKSADRAEFELPWILAALSDVKNINWLDAISTVTEVTLSSITDDILNQLADVQADCPIEIIFYGGMAKNTFIKESIQHRLSQQYPVTYSDLQQWGLDADYCEATLMAYLGYLAVNKKSVDLSYMKRQDAVLSSARLGIVVHS